MKILKRMIFSMLLIVSCQTHQQNNPLTFKSENINPNEFCDSLIHKAEKIQYFYVNSQKYLNKNDTLNSYSEIEKSIEIINNLNQQEMDSLLDSKQFSKLIDSVNLFRSIFITGEEIVTDTSEIVLQEDSLNLELDSLAETLSSDLPEINKTDLDTAIFTIPIVINKKVNNTIRYFTKGRGKAVIQRLLERGSKYKILIESILEEEGLPKDLYYLAMIESGFNPRAQSWARAVGPWQFIKATGKAYGLKNSYWFDDRRDVENSTRAAARHLKDLYNRFGDWYLAMAGYNCNPKKIERRVKAQKTKDYFALKNLPRETRGYVPNFLAAMIIGHNPEKFGIQFEELTPMEYERIYIKEAVDLNHIAKASNADYQTIRDLNPAILKWVTPSDIDSMYINVPLNTGERVLNYIDSLPENEKQKYISYIVKSGDAPSLIARKFKIEMSLLNKINNKKSSFLRVGERLLIPVPDNIAAHYQAVEKESKPKNVKRVTKTKTKESLKDFDKISYTVKNGDTLGHIAEAYGTRAQRIREWNGMYFGQALRIGQQLILFVKKGYTPNLKILDYSSVTSGSKK